MSIMIGFAIFSLYSTLVSPVADPFDVNMGYSVLWFVFLYIIGAYIKKYHFEENVNLNTSVIILIISFFIPWVMKTIVAFFTKQLFGISIGEDILLSYCSPFILAMAVAYVLVFLNIKIGDKLQKIIVFFSPATFGVYLIHNNRLFLEKIISNRYTSISSEQSWKIIIIVLGSALLIVMSCMMLDLLRIAMFDFVEKKYNRTILDLCLGEKNDKCSDSYL